MIRFWLWFLLTALEISIIMTSLYVGRTLGIWPLWAKFLLVGVGMYQLWQAHKQLERPKW